MTFGTGRGINFLVFGLGGTEIIVIVLVALLFLGPDKLPETATKISRGIRDLRKQSKALQETIENDERIGGAIRDLRSALHDDPTRPARPVVRPVVRPDVAPAGQVTALAGATVPGPLPLPSSDSAARVDSAAKTAGDAVVSTDLSALPAVAPATVGQAASTNPSATTSEGSPLIVAAPDAVAKGSRGDA